MKKLLLYTLTVAMLVGLLLSMTVLAAGESFILYFSFDKEYYEIGDTVTVQMHLDRTDSAANYDMYAFESGAMFNTAYLEYIGCTERAKDMRVSDTSVYYAGTYHRVDVRFHGLGVPVDRTAELVVTTLQFKALNNIRSDKIMFLSSSVYPAKSQSVTPTVTNGVYIIGNPNVPAFAVSFSSGAESVTGTAPAAVDDKAEGDLLTLPACSWLREGYTFAGWSDGVSVLDAGAQYTMPAAAVTFTAQWTRDPVKRNISFTAGNLSAGETASGQAPEPRQLFPGEKLSLPTQNTLALTGFSFEGWSLEDGLYQPGDVYAVPDGDVTFAAVWKSIDVGTTTGGGGTVTPAEDVEPPQAWTTPFRDVRESDWFYQYVQYANEKNLMGGTEDDLFAPLTPMNRAMMVTVLYRAAGSPAVTGASPFSDVPAGTWYTDAVIWAASGGIVDGMDSEHFAPLQNLSRQQMVTILWRLRGRPQSADAGAAAAAFADWDTVADWARDAFAWAVQQEIINGIDGNAVPGGTATRAQFAAVMSREGAGS